MIKFLEIINIAMVQLNLKLGFEFEGEVEDWLTKYIE